jgi:tetratricopeptide (TPR) repeat protein
VDRAQIHILTCDKHLETPALQFKTPEEHYDYAVSLINAGDYVTAREHLDRLLKGNPKAEFVLYGLAALHCLTGHVEESLKTLDEAIQLKPALRFQARNDTDFQNLAEDPRFTELLYPDPGAEETASREEEASAY